MDDKKKKKKTLVILKLSTVIQRFWKHVRDQYAKEKYILVGECTFSNRYHAIQTRLSRSLILLFRMFRLKLPRKKREKKANLNSGERKEIERGKGKSLSHCFTSSSSSSSSFFFFVFFFLFILASYSCQFSVHIVTFEECLQTQKTTLKKNVSPQTREQKKNFHLQRKNFCMLKKCCRNCGSINFPTSSSLPPSSLSFLPFISVKERPVSFCCRYELCDFFTSFISSPSSSSSSSFFYSLAFTFRLT